MIIISKNVSSQIQALNALCTLMVVALHSYSRQGYVIGSTPYLIQELFIGGVCNIAVPTFFITSGLLFFKDIENPFNKYYQKLQSRFKTIIIPYLSYSLLALCSTIFLQSITRSNTFLNGDTSDDFVFSIHSFFVAWILDPQVGKAGHLWFLRDLIVLFLLSPLIFWFIHKFRFIPIGFLLLLWLFELQMLPIIVSRNYLLSIESLCFFALGSYLAISNFKLAEFLEKIEKIKYPIICFWLVDVCVRILNDPDLDIWYKRSYDSITTLLLYKLGILLGILSTVLISKALVRNRLIIWLSSFSFAIYLFHYPLAVYVKRGVMLLNLDPLPTFFCRYLLTVGLTVILVFALRYTIPNLYGFLTGNRGLKNT